MGVVSGAAVGLLELGGGEEEADRGASWVEVGAGSARVPLGRVENMRGTWGRGRRRAELGSQPPRDCKGGALAAGAGAGRGSEGRRGQARLRGQHTWPPHRDPGFGLPSCLSFPKSLVRLSAITTTSVSQAQALGLRVN